MARYTDVDVLLNELPDDLPYKASVKRVLMQAPTADVVPKSEVDKWYHEYHAIKDALKQEKIYHRETEKLADKYCVEIQTVKAEVAREIFEEIARNECHDITGKTTMYVLMAEKFAELKKKYVKEKEGQV